MASLTDAAAENGARDLATWEEDVQEKWQPPLLTWRGGKEVGGDLSRLLSKVPSFLISSVKTHPKAIYMGLRHPFSAPLSLLTRKGKTIAKHGSVA